MTPTQTAAEKKAEKDAAEAKAAEQSQAREAAEAVAEQERSEGKEAKAAAEEREEIKADAWSLVDRIGKLSRSEIVQIHGFLDRALLERGEEPEQAPSQSVKELASVLPINKDADITSKKAAKAISDSDLGDNAGVELDEADVAAYTVRQGTDAGGNPVGPAYVTVVTDQGKKYAAVL